MSVGTEWITIDCIAQGIIYGIARQTMHHRQVHGIEERVATVFFSIREVQHLWLFDTLSLPNFIENVQRSSLYVYYAEIHLNVGKLNYLFAKILLLQVASKLYPHACVL